MASRSVKAPACLALCIVIICCLQHEAAAWGYRNKELQEAAKQRLKALRESRRFFNHVPAPQKRAEDLPKNFNWCDIDGTNYCTSNWNQ